MERININLEKEDILVSNGDFIYFQSKMENKIYEIFIAQVDSRKAMAFELSSCNRWSGEIIAEKSMFLWSLRELLNYKANSQCHDFTKVKVEKRGGHWKREKNK